MVLNLNVIKFSDAHGVLEVVNYDNHDGDFMSVVGRRDASLEKGNWLGKSHAPLQVRFTGGMIPGRTFHNNVTLVTAWDSGDYELKMRIGSRGDILTIPVGGSRDVHLSIDTSGRLTISSPGGFKHQGDDVVVDIRDYL